MKNQALSKKLRYGGITAVLTALIIAAVIIVNVLMSTFTQTFRWYVDLTPDDLYTLSDECIDVIRNGDDEFEESTSPIEALDRTRAANKAYNAEHGLKEGDEGWKDEKEMVSLIFCQDPDKLEDSATTRYVYHTALDLADEFPDYIEVVHYNILRNPSVVSRFLTTSTSTIATTNVIVESGSEFRVYTLRSFFVFNTDSDEEPWAYNGEKKFTSGILAVTRAEAPIAAFTVNHGETVSDYELFTAISDAGFIPMTIDLQNDPIPSDCRLMVIYNPNSDLMIAGEGAVDPASDEIAKLDAFLDAGNSLLVFAGPNTPVLENFEEYLEEWGIVFNRTPAPDKAPYMVRDSLHSLTTDGYSVVADYVTTGVGSSMTEVMRKAGTPKSVIFPEATTISYSDRYSLSHHEADSTVSGDVEYDFYSYVTNGIERDIYDVFVTSPDAKAYANGAEVAQATKQTPLKLMTVTVESRYTQEDNYSGITEPTYVVACSSVGFASEKYMQSSAYGNSDMILSCCRVIGQEPVPVGLTFKPFADYTIDIITAAEAREYTIILTAVPVAICAVLSVVLLVRRKYR